MNIYNNGKDISDGCASVKYRSDDFLVKKKNYVVIKPNDKYSKIYRSYGCKEKKAKFTKIFLNLPVGEYKAIMGYSFNKNTFKRFEMYEYFKESWSGELLSDTITFEIR